MGKKPTFEERLAALEKIVEELEGGSLTLDEALQRYEQGVAAHKACIETLAAAEKRIEILVKGESGQLETRPLDSSEGES